MLSSPSSARSAARGVRVRCRVLGSPVQWLSRRRSTMVKARKFVLARCFQGEPQLSDMRLEEEELPALQDGEILCEAEFVSLDPYQRAYAAALKPGDVLLGSQVARVVDSRNARFPVGRRLVGYWGWRDRTVVDVTHQPPGFAPPTLVPEALGGADGDLPSSLALGVLGMPGNTAYFGLLELCQPQPGEVVVVTGAAGAVGSLVGQIAKVKGCRAVGFAGSDEKVRWLTEELGFDAAFNYKTCDVGEALRKAAPDGVDVYFDNVGGVQSSVIINQMRARGRIAVCGSISAYNADPSKVPVAPILQPAMVMKELKMEGFLVHRWLDRWDEGVHQNLRWIREGKLKYRETVTQGFLNLPHAFIGMLNGENIGKAVVKV